MREPFSCSFPLPLHVTQHPIDTYSKSNTQEAKKTQKTPFTYVKNIGTSSSHGTAASPVPPGVVMGTVAVFEASQNLLTVVGDIAESVIRIQDAAALRLEIMNGYPRVRTL